MPLVKSGGFERPSLSFKEEQIIFAELALDTQFFFSNDLFATLIEQNREEHINFISQFEGDISVTSQKIKELLDAFEQIAFDFAHFCFYHKDEALEEYKEKFEPAKEEMVVEKGAKKDKREHKGEKKIEKKPNERRGGCADCCVII